MTNFTINENVPVEQHYTERATSHIQALGSVLLSKLGECATEALDQLDMLVYDVNRGEHTLQAYKHQKREARLGAMAARYNLV